MLVKGFFGVSKFFSVMLLTLGVSSLFAASTSYLVTSTVDSMATGTFRYALTQALSKGNAIVSFDPIIFPSSLTPAPKITLTDHLPLITKTVTIRGPVLNSGRFILDGGGQYQAFLVGDSKGGSVIFSLSNINIQNMKSQGGTNGSGGLGAGGAICVFSGSTLSLTNVDISNCSAVGGSGSFGPKGGGSGFRLISPVLSTYLLGGCGANLYTPIPISGGAHGLSDGLGKNGGNGPLYGEGGGAGGNGLYYGGKGGNGAFGGGGGGSGHGDYYGGQPGGVGGFGAGGGGMFVSAKYPPNEFTIIPSPSGFAGGIGSCFANLNHQNAMEACGGPGASLGGILFLDDNTTSTFTNVSLGGGSVGVVPGFDNNIIRDPSDDSSTVYPLSSYPKVGNLEWKKYQGNALGSILFFVGGNSAKSSVLNYIVPENQTNKITGAQNTASTIAMSLSKTCKAHPTLSINGATKGGTLLLENVNTSHFFGNISVNSGTLTLSNSILGAPNSNGIQKNLFLMSTESLFNGSGSFFGVIQGMGTVDNSSGSLNLTAGSTLRGGIEGSTTQNVGILNYKGDIDLSQINYSFEIDPTKKVSSSLSIVGAVKGISLNNLSIIIKNADSLKVGTSFTILTSSKIFSCSLPSPASCNLSAKMKGTYAINGNSLTFTITSA